MEHVVSAIEREKNRTQEVWKSISWFDHYILSICGRTSQTQWVREYVEVLAATEKVLQPHFEDVRAIRANRALLIAYIQWYNTSTEVLLSYTKPPESRSSEDELVALARKLEELWDDAWIAYTLTMMPWMRDPSHVPRLHQVPDLLDNAVSS